MNKKLKNCLIAFVILLLGIYSMYCALCYFGDRALPDTRTIYLSYNSFYKSAKENTFMEALPESASRKKYFHQTYFFNDRDGYGATYTEEEYEAAKQIYLQKRWDYMNQLLCYKYVSGERIAKTEEEKQETLAYWNPYSMDDTTRQEPDMATVFERYNVNFFDIIAKESVEDGNYHFIWCWEQGVDSDYISLDCVIYNDETREIIEISCLKKGLSW